MLTRFNLQSNRRSEMIDITGKVRKAMQESKVTEGMVTVYCPHTTAGITINEGADPEVAGDILRRLEELYPWDHPGYRHGEGNSAAHLKASSLGASQTIPLENGKLLLGTWQVIYFCEFDGPRRRNCLVRVISASP